MDAIHQAYEDRFKAIMPEDVWLALSASEREEAEVLVKLDDRSGFKLARSVGVGFEAMKTGYVGHGAIPWFELATPMKYSLFQLAPQELVLQLLAWDITHPDFMRTFFMSGSLDEKLFDQRLSTLGAMLGNENMAPDKLVSVLRGVEQAWPTIYGTDAAAFAELLHHVLWDKWMPYEFPAPTLAMLVTYFKSRGMKAEAEAYEPEAIAAYLKEIYE